MSEIVTCKYCHESIEKSGEKDKKGNDRFVHSDTKFYQCISRDYVLGSEWGDGFMERCFPNAYDHLIGKHAEPEEEKIE